MGGAAALPMERARAKLLEGRAMGAHVGCCVWLCWVVACGRVP
jgi:hypothetical protein